MPEQYADSALVQPKSSWSSDHILVLFWAVGVVLAAVWMLISNLRLGIRLRRSSRTLPSKARIPVRVTDLVASPCLFGLVPEIYIPRSAEHSEDLPYILRHELTHLRHGDHVFALLRCLCLAVWWWNPLVWAAAVLSRLDGELACDESVLCELDQSQRLSYGQALLRQVPQKGAFRGTASLSTSMSVTANAIRERLLRIVKPRKKRLVLILLSLVLVTALVGCTFSGTKQKIELPEEVKAEESKETEVVETDYNNPEEISNEHLERPDVDISEEKPVSQEETFFIQFPEIEPDSMQAYLDKNPEALAQGWFELRVDKAGLDQDGTEIRSVLGDRVLALDVKNGIELFRVEGEHWRGVLAIVMDSSRVGMRWSEARETGGQTVRQIAESHGAVLGVNASGFPDQDGGLAGYAMCDGEGLGEHAEAGYKRLELRKNGLLYVVDVTLPVDAQTTDAVEFTPALIVDGALAITEDTDWNGYHPRTIVGQTSDGKMMLLVVEGRGAGGSLGASVYECAVILQRYGCVQAMNLDGGSSSVMYYNGRTITACSNPALEDGRRLPNAWLCFPS